MREAVSFIDTAFLFRNTTAGYLHSMEDKGVYCNGGYDKLIFIVYICQRNGLFNPFL